MVDFGACGSCSEKLSHRKNWLLFPHLILSLSLADIEEEEDKEPGPWKGPGPVANLGHSCACLRAHGG